MINPNDFWMPSKANMMLVAALAVLFIVFASFVWREKAVDERESLHKHIAARFAYLAGTSTLVIGVIMQSFQHMVDNWLVITLGVMILAKAVGFLYARKKY
jgi:uncharacterized membrane protein